MIDLTTGREIESEILTPSEARERRRKARRKMRQMNENDHKAGLDVLAMGAQRAGRGDFHGAVNTLFAGFGRILLRAAKRSLTK